MKKIVYLFVISAQLAAHSQTPTNITVNTSEPGTSSKADLDAFYLNHVIYIKAFVLSDIYSSVTANEMAYMVTTLRQNISDGKRTQFIIETGKKTAYRLAVFVVTNNAKTQLVLLTNFNPKNGEFEKKIKPDFYATSAEIKNTTVIGNVFELPLENEKKYRDENDYIALINVSIFNNQVDTTEMMQWFTLAETHQEKLINNLNWLKSYYYLTQRDFEKSNDFLAALKSSVAASPEGERNQWGMFVNVLSAEIATMEAIENLPAGK